MEIKYTNRVPQFLRRFNTGKDQALADISRVGVDNIKGETPVDTGLLRSSNKSKIKGDDVVFYNDEEYAPYVEFGTFVQSANPFMRRGLAKSYGSFLSILIRKFRV